MAYIDLDEINRLHPKLTVKYPLSFANGISVAISEINRLPNADVVPKSEVARLQSQVKRLKMYDEERDIALHARLIAETRTKVASEIFEDIDELMIDHAKGDIDNHWLYVGIEKIKKRYTEDDL